jgi:hypothetical protein
MLSDKQLQSIPRQAAKKGVKYNGSADSIKDRNHNRNIIISLFVDSIKIRKEHNRYIIISLPIDLIKVRKEHNRYIIISLPVDPIKVRK